LKALPIFTSVTSAPWLRAPLPAGATSVSWKRQECRVTEEGEPVHAQSIISLPLASGKCVLPTFNASPDDPFLQRVNVSGKKWVIVTDLNGEPAFVLDSHHFLRNALFNQLDKNQGACWHRPVIVRDMRTRLGDVIGRLKVVQERPDDDVIDNDLILET
jgi:hypothetical protein